ncbi:hypothetical protein HAX54_018071 [Datura stramonium]|uniref:C2H2-type domain-containing protein n=1 Tax=Datura stramonium TaxID=4076 RepID=A0ABS8S4I1_DATST|nr:hypothetical protein [Datura stramonium]
MSACRLFFLLGASIVRNGNKPTNIYSPFSQTFHKKPLPSLLYGSEATIVPATLRDQHRRTSLVSPKNHPWPEWVTPVLTSLVTVPTFSKSCPPKICGQLWERAVLIYSGKVVNHIWMHLNRRRRGMWCLQSPVDHVIAYLDIEES